MFWGTGYQQHFGQDFAGLATSDGSRIFLKNKEGLFFSIFDSQKELGDIKGILGIGHCGKTDEPYLVNSRFGEIALCFSGNIINIEEIKKKLKEAGHSFLREDEVEIIEKMISREENIIAGIERMAQEIKGAFILLILTKKEIYAVQSPRATWSLVISKKRGASALASDPSGLSNLGFEILRDAEPGVIILLKKGIAETKKELVSPALRQCSFLWNYFLYPPAKIRGKTAKQVRMALGAKMALRDFHEGFTPDIITLVPDSARAYALGYKRQFDQLMNAGKINKTPIYDESLIKYGYVGRSFVFKDKKNKRSVAFYKQIPSEEDYRGLSVVVWDDSTVFGTQLEYDLIPKLKKFTGAEEFHVRIGNPEICSFCSWGKTAKEEGRKTLFSVRRSTTEEKLETLKVRSIKYSSIADIVEVIGLPEGQLCLDCDLLSEEK